MTTRILALIVAAAALTACNDAAPVTATAPAPVGRAPAYAASTRTTSPTGKGIDVADDTNPPARTRFRVDYHNGEVIISPNVYFIWYGTWSSVDESIVSDFVSNLAFSPYWNIASRYPRYDGQVSTGLVFLGGMVTDSYSHGPTLSDADVEDVIQQKLNVGALPADPSGIYVVLGSADIWESSGLQMTYCALHSTFVHQGSTMRSIFVGNPQRSPTRCAPQGVGPNGSLGGDGVVTLLSGELFNVVTDPDLASWYDKLALEGADKCVWTFGTTYKASNGALANVHLGTRDFLVQQLWVPNKNSGACALSL